MNHLFAQVPQTLMRSPAWRSLSGAQHRVRDAIASHRPDKSGNVWPSVETIARLSGVSIRTTEKSIKKLIELGLIVKTSGGGRGRSNRYRVVLNPGDLVGVSTSQTPAKLSGFEDKKPRPNDPVNPGQAVHKTPAKRPGEERKKRETKRGGATSEVVRMPPGDMQLSLAGIPIDPLLTDPGKAVVFTFPTQGGDGGKGGGGGVWSMTRDQLWQMREDYTTVHIDTELHGLIAWLEANIEKRKKPGAMMSWLRSLMARKANELADKGRTYPARYDGWGHASLPTDPTDEELDTIVGSGGMDGSGGSVAGAEDAA